MAVRDEMRVRAALRSLLAEAYRSGALDDVNVGTPLDAAISRACKLLRVDRQRVDESLDGQNAARIVEGSA